MRVAYVCADPGVPIFGRKGCSIHAQEVMRSLVRRGACVDLYSPRIEGERPQGLENIGVHALPRSRDCGPRRRERGALAANQALRALLQRNGPYDLVYERYSLWSFAAMEHARAVEAQGVLEVNAPLIEEQARHRGLHDRSVAERVARRVMASATALIAVSEEVAAYLHSQPNTQERVHVVPNGVDPERFAARSPGRFRRPWKDYTVGFLGTLRPWHGLAILVEAFALLHRWHRASRLLVVGDGPGRSSLMRDLAARGLWEAVHLTGAVAPEEVPEWLHSMDVGVAPYPGDASFYFSPLKVFEYMAAGLPVVCSRMGQMAQLIQHDRNGLLCPPGNAMALALELDRLRRDPALRARLGRAARRRVLRQHTWDAVVQRTLDFVGLGAAPSVRAAEVA